MLGVAVQLRDEDWGFAAADGGDGDNDPKLGFLFVLLVADGDADGLEGGVEVFQAEAVVAGGDGVGDAAVAKVCQLDVDRGVGRDGVAKADGLGVDANLDAVDVGDVGEVVGVKQAGVFGVETLVEGVGVEQHAEVGALGPEGFEGHVEIDESHGLAVGEDHFLIKFGYGVGHRGAKAAVDVAEESCNACELDLVGVHIMVTQAGGYGCNDEGVLVGFRQGEVGFEEVSCVLVESTLGFGRDIGGPGVVVVGMKCFGV